MRSGGRSGSPDQSRCLRTQLLPESVISILDGQHRELVRGTLTACGVGAGQVAGQRRQRPTVAGNVVEDQQQDALALAQDKELSSQRDLGTKIKALLNRGGEGLGRGGLRRQTPDLSA